PRAGRWRSWPAAGGLRCWPRAPAPSAGSASRSTARTSCDRTRPAASTSGSPWATAGEGRRRASGGSTTSGSNWPGESRRADMAGEAEGPVLVLDRLTKKYGDFTALDGLTLEVGRGQILGLIGPNGAGKTTTIRILVGQLRPTSGKAVIAGA